MRKVIYAVYPALFIACVIWAIHTAIESKIEESRETKTKAILKQWDYRGQRIREFVKYANARVETLRTVDFTNMSDGEVSIIIKHLNFCADLASVAGAKNPEKQAGEDVRSALHLANMFGKD